MKILLTMICFLPLCALASETETLTCQGRELVAGGDGKTGAVVVSVTRKEAATPDYSINFGVEFAGTPLIGTGISCGVALPANLECTSVVKNPGKLAVVIDSTCGSFFRRGSIPVYQFHTGIVFSSDRSHGRLNCRGSNGQQSALTAIEFNNCEAK